MGILDPDTGAETNPVQMSDLVETNQLPENTAPLPAIRNKAAQTAALSDDPAAASQNYSQMMLEASQGQSTTQDALSTQIDNNVKAQDFQSVMHVLSDPKIPQAQKTAIVGSYSQSQLLSDKATTIQTQLLSKPSKGESQDGENARTSTADAVGEIYQARTAVQGLANKFLASQPDPTLAGATADFAGTLAPFSTSQRTAQLVNNLDKETNGSSTFGSDLGAFIQPGQSIANIREHLNTIPPDQRVPFAQAVLKAIKNSSSVFGNDNQYEQFNNVTKIFDQGGYSGVDQFVDNIAPLLDAIGLGSAASGARRFLGKAGELGAVAKAGAVAERVEPGAFDLSHSFGFNPNEAKVEPTGSVASGPTANGSKVEPTLEGTKTPVQAPQTVPTTLGGTGVAPDVAKPNNGALLTPEGTKTAAQPTDQAVPTLLGGSGTKTVETSVSQVSKVSEDTALAGKRDYYAFQKNLGASDPEAASHVSSAQNLAEEHNQAVNVWESENGTVGVVIASRKSPFINGRKITTIYPKSMIGEEATQAVDKTPALFRPLVNREDVESRIARNAPKGVENPASVIEVAQQSNPEQVQNLTKMIIQAPDDNAANAVAGLSKNDAVSTIIQPQAATESAEVLTKTANPDDLLRLEDPMRPDPEVLDVLWDSGGTWFNPAEKAAARARLINDFGQADGLIMNVPMSSATLDGTRIKFTGMYETPGGGFSNAEQAVEQAKYAFRNYGVLDSDITVYAKQGLDHVPVSLDEVRGKEGSYKIGIDMYHEYDPTDIGKLTELDVKKNAFDRIPMMPLFQRSELTRNLFDAASVLHPQLTQAGEVAADQAARLDKVLLNKATKYSDGYTNLPAVAGDSAKARRAKIDDYLREANFNGIGYDQGDLIARGFTAQEQSVIKDWRDFWDTHYFLENRDLVRTLDSQGFKIFKNSTTELYAKPIGKNSTLGRFYDPATDSVRQFAAGELDQLYDNGGTMAKLRRPVNFAGEEAEYMISRENPQEYLRGFRDTDRVLNYRKGYFQLQYKAPKFVDKVEYTASGAEKSRKTVAVAGDTAEAQHFVKRMTSNAPNDVYEIRNDNKALSNGSNEAWDINSSGGRIGQRHRGQLLEDASGLNRLGDGSYIVNPVDSAINAARSIAGRVTSRPMIESMQERFMQQYAKYLPSDGFGGTRYPKSLDEIAKKGEVTSKGIADARSTFAYIEFLKNGYSNSLDQAGKAMFNAIADGFGNRGWTTLERGSRAVGEKSVTGTAKGSVFAAYIGTNPLRQWAIQPYQMVRTFSYNPTGWLSLAIPKYFFEIASKTAKLGPETAFTKFMDASGLLDAVDKSNLVRGTLMQATDHSNGIVRGLTSVPAMLRKMGFDVGESANLMGHGAAVYDRYMRLGRDLTNKEVRDNAYGEIRALSYAMNSAGDMPYNSNSAAFVFQFLQMPHKAILQMTNRRLELSTRIQMALGDIALFGAPTATVAALLGKDVLPDNPTARDAVSHGLMVTMYNQIFRGMSEDYKGIDFSALDPRQMDGWYKMAQAVWGGGISAAIKNSPIGTITGGRFENAIQSVGRYFNAIPEFDDNDPTKFTTMLNDIASITSGYSNSRKAYLAYTLGQRRDSYGDLIDDNTSTPEIIAQLFGFGAASQKELFDLSQRSNEITKDHKTEVINAVNEMKKYYAEKLDQGDSDPKFITGVTGAAMKAFENDPEAMFLVQQELRKSMTPKDVALMNQILKRSDLPNPGEIRDQINQIPGISDAQRNQLLQLVTDSENAKDDLANFNKNRKGK